MNNRSFIGNAFVAACAFCTSVAALATPCQKDTPFDAWIEGLRQEAATQGVSAQSFAAALPNLKLDPKPLANDQNQQVLQENFLEFSDHTATKERLQKAAKLASTYKALFDRIDAQYGVPAPALLTLWALESDFGAFTGRIQILRALTTLAYDCRRPTFFRANLISALQLIEKGYVKPTEMVGNLFGELGGVQFTPDLYLRYAVDFDGDGRVDMVKSIPDTLGSAANFLAAQGWKRGQPWLQEVRMPADLRWEEADVAIQHPRSEWVKWGVTAMQGTLPSDELPAALLLPMGRSGPAFLAYPNFKAFLAWNSSLTYTTTVAYTATRIAGAPVVNHNVKVKILSTPQVVELQSLLVAKGYLTGKADGKLGSSSRAAIRKAQLATGLPADAYPSLELIDRLKH